MSVEPGNRGIVQRFGGETGYFVKGRMPVAGDTCLLYPIDGSNLPVCIPFTGLDIGDFVFLMPDFNFDFLIQLPTTSDWYAGYTDHDLKVSVQGGYIYGDTSPGPLGGCVKILPGSPYGNPRFGDVEYNFADGRFENFPYADDFAVCLRDHRTYLEIWIVGARWPDYGSSGAYSFYLFNQFVATVTPNMFQQNYVYYHGFFTLS